MTDADKVYVSTMPKQKLLAREPTEEMSRAAHMLTLTKGMHAEDGYATITFEEIFREMWDNAPEVPN